MGAYRDYISEDADMQTMLFRYSIMVDVFNARLPQELVCKNKLDDELIRKLLKALYCTTIPIFFPMFLRLKMKSEKTRELTKPTFCPMSSFKRLSCYAPIPKSMMI